MTNELQRTKPKPELVRIGDRAVSAHGWRSSLVVDHLVEHLTRPRDKMCSVDCMARTFFGRPSPVTRKRVRDHMRGLSQRCLNEGRFLVIEYGPGRRATGCKLFEGGTEDRQNARAQLDRMLQRGVISFQKYDQACDLIGDPIEPDDSSLAAQA